MKIDKSVLTKIVNFCKSHPNATIMSGMGLSIGLVLTVALGGFGYMLDMKDDIYEEIINDKGEC